MILVRTPQPHPTESLTGYVLRVAEENGYDSPWAIFRMAGVEQHEMKGAGLSPAKLAPLVGLPPEGLDHLAYHAIDETGQREYRLLGRGLGRCLSIEPLRLTRPALCPHCVAEFGFIDAFFDLRLAVACPRHRCMLVTECPTCREPLTWFRRGLLQCKCGASLASAVTPPAKAEVASLMAILWATLHNVPLSTCDVDGTLPAEYLRSLSFRSLVAKLPALADFNRPKANGNPVLIVEGMVEALANWPRGLHTLLEALGREAPAKTASLRKRHERFYQCFFKSPRYKAEFDWMRQEFIRYGLDHASDAIVDDRLLRGEEVQRRYVSKSELARQLGVSPVTLRRWAEKGKIELSAAKAGKLTRYVGDSHAAQFQLEDDDKGRVLSPREAAASLGLPVSVLNRIKMTEHFQPKYRLKQKGGFHSADVEALQKQLLALTPMVKPEALADSDTIGLQAALGNFKFHSAEQKADLLISYLDGRLKSVGRTGVSTDDIRVLREDVGQLVSRSRAARAGDSLSQQEAAKVIKCDPQAIRPLTEQGFLAMVEGRRDTRVTSASVSRFAGEYMSLSSLAHDLQTSSRYLTRLCARNEVPVLSMPRSTGAGDIPFVKVEAVARVRAHLPKQQSSAPAASTTES